MSSSLPITSEAVGLAAQLTARLQPMFAQPVILVDPSDPVIGGPQCIVAACERLAVLEGKCWAHHRRGIDRDGVVAFRAVNLMPKAPPGLVVPRRAVCRLTRGC